MHKVNYVGSILHLKLSRLDNFFEILIASSCIISLLSVISLLLLWFFCRGWLVWYPFLLGRVRYPYFRVIFRMKYTWGCTRACCNMLVIVVGNLRRCLGTGRRSQVFGDWTRINQTALCSNFYLLFTKFLFWIWRIYLFVKVVVFCEYLLLSLVQSFLQINSF